MCQGNWRYPQNINFAVKGSLIKSFLDVNGIYYVKEKTYKLIDSQTKASQAARYTFSLEFYQWAAQLPFVR